MKKDSIKKFLKRLTAQSGMTLIELVIVIVVTGILVVTILPFFRMNIESLKVVASYRNCSTHLNSPGSRQSAPQDLRRLKRFDKIVIEFQLS